MKAITTILATNVLFSISGTILAGEPIISTEKAVTAEAPANTVSDAWRFKITPYVMLPTLNGNIKTSGGGDIDLPTGNADSDWQLSVPLAFDLGKGRWGVGLEFFRLGYSGEAKLNQGRMINQQLDFDVTFTHTKAFAYYRVLENDKHLVDLYAGANIVYLKFETKLAGVFNGSSNSSDTWVDPMMGVQYRYNINDKWQILARGELGAGDSAITWDAMLGIDYVLSEHWAFGAGYRTIGLDFSGSDAEYEVGLNGPIFNVSYTF